MRYHNRYYLSGIGHKTARAGCSDETEAMDQNNAQT